MTRRTARATWLATTLLLLAACSHPVREAPQAPAGDEARAPAGTPGVPEPKSRQGNPAFYEVFGQRYHTLSTSRGYRERGVASWYGTKFHSQPTSSGEPYDMYALTAAHTSLPLPTWVEVHNLSNGHRVVVRVNDRGPFVDNRIIDLSYAAARELEMIGDGTALVEVRALHSPDEISRDAVVATRHAASRPIRRTPGADGPPPPGVTRVVGTRPAAANRRQAAPLPAPAPAPLPEPPSGQAAESDSEAPASEPRLFVQVGAFSSRDNATGLLDRLQADGFDDAFKIEEQAGEGSLYRVRIGPIVDVRAYDLVIEELRSLDIHETRLITEE